jgi:hypothetical protein
VLKKTALQHSPLGPLGPIIGKLKVCPVRIGACACAASTKRNSMQRTRNLFMLYPSCAGGGNFEACFASFFTALETHYP